jgi:hypothetical protein
LIDFGNNENTFSLILGIGTWILPVVFTHFTKEIVDWLRNFSAAYSQSFVSMPPQSDGTR